MEAKRGRDGPAAAVRRLYGRSRGKALRAGQQRLLTEALPVSGAGKVLKRVLRDELAAATA